MSQRRPYKKSNKTDTVGGRLRAARLAAGLTQAHMSEIVHRHYSQWNIASIRVMISRIENGENIGEQTTLLDVAARVVGVQTKWLIGDGAQSTGTHQPDYLQSDGSRPVTLGVSRDGTIEYSREKRRSRRIRFWPILSVETEAIAEQVRAAVCCYRSGRYVVENWYSGDVDDFCDAHCRISERFWEAYTRLKSRS
jgi:transcriptional regulator with XRE-family HTH domain